jgi:hypothetical protein
LIDLHYYAGKHKPIPKFAFEYVKLKLNYAIVLEMYIRAEGVCPGRASTDAAIRIGRLTDANSG